MWTYAYRGEERHVVHVQLRCSRTCGTCTAWSTTRRSHRAAGSTSISRLTNSGEHVWIYVCLADLQRAGPRTFQKLTFDTGSPSIQLVDTGAVEIPDRHIHANNKGGCHRLRGCKTKRQQGCSDHSQQLAYAVCHSDDGRVAAVVV
jgi:hypothetical protein